MHQKNMVFLLNELFAKIGVWSLRHRWWVLLLCIITLGASIYFASTVRIDNGFESFFDAQDPTYDSYLQYREDFGSDEIAYLLYHAPDYAEGIFDLQVMQKIAKLTEELEGELPFVKKVRSISNAEVLLGTVDGIDITKLSDEFPQSQAALLSFRDRFMQKQLYIGGLVSEDQVYGAIQIEMDRSSIDPVEEIRLDPDGGDGLSNLYPQVVDEAIQELLSSPQYQGIEFYISGDVPLNSVYNLIIEDEMPTLGGISFLVIGVLLLIFFRGSLMGIVGPLAVVFLAIIMTAGFVGLMSWDIDMMFGMLPTLLTAVGVAHAVHIIAEFRIFLQRYGDRDRALRETLYLVGAPCLLTSLTTAAGFFAMVVSPIKALEHMAVYTALGVLAAFFLSITLLTFFLSFSKTSQVVNQEKKQDLVFERILQGIARFVIRYQKRVLLVTLVIFCGAATGIQRIVVDSNFLLDFSDQVAIKKDTAFIDEVMGGMNSVVYLFDTGKADGIKNPLALKELERFQDYADGHDIVKKSYSIVNLLKDINQSFHNNDPAYYRLPETQELVAQYLLVYEMSGGEELENFMSQDYSRASLELRTRLTETSKTGLFTQSMEEYQSIKPLTENSTQVTGIGTLWIVLLDYISTSQIRGVLLALFVISLMMCFIFRSFKIGLVSMIPNIAPVVITLGAMGWLGITLDYFKLMIATVAIGIAVDDTIHMMSRFYHEFDRRGNYQEALLAAMSDVGRALVITSVVLIAGFMVFTLSVMDSQKWFGILLSTTIFVALISDFFVMPALVLVFKPFGKESAKERIEESTNEELEVSDGLLPHRAPESAK